MNKVNTLKINNSLIKLESENPILKSRSHSFSPLNIAGKIVIKINNNYINNNNIKNKAHHNQRSSIKTISKKDDSETSSREMNYFELFPSAETPHLNEYIENSNENNINSNNFKNFSYGLFSFHNNNNNKKQKNNFSFVNNTINFKNNSNYYNEDFNNNNNLNLNSNEINNKFNYINSKFKKTEINFSSTNNPKVIKRKISIPSHLRRKVQFNLDSKLNLKESSLSLSKLDIKKNMNNKNRSLININKTKISLNDTKLIKNTIITFKTSNISSNLSFSARYSYRCPKRSIRLEKFRRIAITKPIINKNRKMKLKLSTEQKTKVLLPIHFFIEAEK